MKKLFIVAVVVLGAAFAKAQGAKIAKELRSYINAESSDEIIEVKDKTGKKHYVKSAKAKTAHHIGGTSTSNSTVVFDAFNAHPEWQDMSVIVDWTGSMYSYVGQVVRWHHVNKDKQLIHNMVLFNDGDDNTNRNGNGKTIGKTGGIYHPDHSDIDAFLKTVASAVDNGNGGDGPENDIEAILASQELCNGKKDFVLIADSSGIRDISLASQIKRPVHIIICDYVSDDYIQLAKITKGSITWPGGYTDYSGSNVCKKRHVHSHDVACAG
ncbi:MAG: hypothetical protein ABF251_09350 [Nonlabens sp.]|uniref:hypothetical protein n=1 Tax=Nonlabens sp. TaxID=1888209 RepID=UPI00321C3369